MNDIEYIKSRLTKAELLAGLAEECSELAQAALKLRRVLDGSNPTPVTKEQATENLMEEYGDVVNCIEAIFTPTHHNQATEIRRVKRTRWARRLAEKDCGQALNWEVDKP